ncbi:adenylyl-sulfate kinase [Polyangium sorediatum]|uniref:Adenylyl-sulfate kinase n=1 Tax=Polyangium sorediatum TaxID=889274 RepID=A0ABT6NWQ2_9BACT|nr:adenylyl-sulfate kinase [Polyangium sorediatum]MDI1432739.1 adenylyl-sulfate kinase [Polyangium sorediatum]
MGGFVVWFTGLSGAGKSTLGAMLAAELRARGVHVEVLDGDEVRTHLSKGLGFSREDRDTNVRRIGFVAKLVARSGACAITGAISPFRAIRDEQRAQIERFVEVYCSASIDALAARDPKGLYRKALAGEIKGFTGVDDPYEPPVAPEVTLSTDRESKEESLAKIVGKLEELGFVPRRAAAILGPGTSLSLVAPHGGELVIRVVQAQERREALAERARSLPTITLDREAEVDLARLADGSLSPLKGFLGSKDWLRVADEMRLEQGLPWPTFVTLAASEEAARAAQARGEAALCTAAGEVVAILEVSDVYRPEDLVRGRKLLGPLGKDDPEITRQLRRGPFLVGGEVQVLGEGLPATGATDPPRRTRQLFQHEGETKVTALRVRSIPRRAEEHLARLALDLTGALWIQVLANVEGGDASRVDPGARGRRSLYEVLASSFPPRRVLVSDGIEVRRSGARRAVLDAILSQNHGASHAVVTLSAEEGGASGAERAFRVYAPGELGVTPLCIEEPFYSTTLHAMATERSAPGDTSTRITATEAEILDRIQRGEAPPPEVVRPEITREIRSMYERAKGG